MNDDELLVYLGGLSSGLEDQPDAFLHALDTVLPVGERLAAPPVANDSTSDMNMDQGGSGDTVERELSGDQDDGDRKIALRRESQRNYLQRRRKKQNDIEKTYQAALRQEESLMMEQEQLVKQNGALEKMREYVDHMVGQVSDMIASARQTVGNAVTSGSSAGQDYLGLLILKGHMIVSDPTDQQIVNYVKSVSYDGILVAREMSYRNMCSLLNQWHSNYGKRASIEKQMSTIFRTRYRILCCVVRDRPDIASSMLSSLLLPPGDDSSPIPGLNPKILPMLTEIDLTLKQRGLLQAAWQDYKAEIEAAHVVFATTCSEASKAAYSAAGGGGGGLSESNIMPESLSEAAQDYLRLIEILARLNTNSGAEILALLKLGGAFHRHFSIMQQATVAKYCSPHIIDPAQVIQTILSSSKPLELLQGDGVRQAQNPDPSG